ncbi:alpha/beta fold hydrolase [Streptomyces avermitilis]|uniref:alpha/beta hydrolase n=1 Tax=Streptomyces avermitilis TaxID=33903 RepID=UPI0033FBBB1C
MQEVVGIPSSGGYSIPALLAGPAADANGTVIMAHGIFADKQENGRYAKQAEIHHALGRRTLRFDWQGHGDHPLPFSESSVAGNIDDLQTVMDYAGRTWDEDLFVVASSFGGAIFLMHQLLPQASHIRKALLLNPITDFTGTFFAPRTGELVEPFSAEKWRQVFAEGTTELVPGKTLSRRMAIELLTGAPHLGFARLQAPTMVIHGSSDASVSHTVTREHALGSDKVVFESIEGADHAFAAQWEEEASFSLIRHWFAN